VVERNDLKTRLGEGLVHGAIDFRFGARERETSDQNFFWKGSGGRDRVIEVGEPDLQKIHSLHGVGDVLPHRPDRVEMLRFDWEYAFDGNQAMRRFQSNDTAPGGGHADRAG